MPPESFLISLPMCALMFPLSEYVIKLKPSLVTFCSKEVQTWVRFTQAAMGNTDEPGHEKMCHMRTTKAQIHAV